MTWQFDSTSSRVFLPEGRAAITCNLRLTYERMNAHHHMEGSLQGCPQPQAIPGVTPRKRKSYHHARVGMKECYCNRCEFD